MKGFLTMFLTAAMGGSAMLGVLSVSPSAMYERAAVVEVGEVAEVRTRVALPEPSLIYREHQAFRSSVVPANFTTLISVENDGEEGVLLKNPADYESHSVARLIGQPTSPLELSANSLHLKTGEPICEVVKN